MIGEDSRGTPVARPSLVAYTRWMYALHAASLVMSVVAVLGLFAQLGESWHLPVGVPSVTQFIVFVVERFFAVPSVIAMIMNYARRSAVRDTWLESHFDWQLKYFWFAVLGLVIFVIVGPLVFLLGLVAVVGVIGACLAVGYRIASGWLRLNDGKPMAPATA